MWRAEKFHNIIYKAASESKYNMGNLGLDEMEQIVKSLLEQIDVNKCSDKNRENIVNSVFPLVCNKKSQNDCHKFLANTINAYLNMCNRYSGRRFEIKDMFATNDHMYINEQKLKNLAVQHDLRYYMSFSSSKFVIEHVLKKETSQDTISKVIMSSVRPELYQKELSFQIQYEPNKSFYFKRSNRWTHVRISKIIMQTAKKQNTIFDSLIYYWRPNDQDDVFAFDPSNFYILATNSTITPDEIEKLAEMSRPWSTEKLILKLELEFSRIPFRNM